MGGSIYSMRVVINAYSNSIGEPFRQGGWGGNKCDVTWIWASALVSPEGSSSMVLESKRRYSVCCCCLSLDAVTVEQREGGPINLLKPTGHVMHKQFNIQQLYVLHTLYLCVFIFLRTNSDLCHLQHKLIGLYTGDEKCLLRGTYWVFN